ELEGPLAPRGGARPVQVAERRLADEDLPGARLLRQSGRDVDVDAEVVATDTARLPGVDADPDAGTPAGDHDRVEPGRPRDDRVEGELRRGEDRHESVAETLDHVPAVRADLVLEHRGHVTQQPK